MRTVGLSAYSRTSASTRNISFAFQATCVGLEDKDRKFLVAFFRWYLSISYLRGRKALVLSVIISPPTHARQPGTADRWLLVPTSHSHSPCPKGRGAFSS